MRVLFDLNILIDLLMDRQPWAAQARPLVARVLNGTLYGYVCATSVTTAYYLARRATGAAQAIAAVEMMLRTFEVAPVGRSELEAALLRRDDCHVRGLPHLGEEHLPRARPSQAGSIAQP